MTNLATKRLLVRSVFPLGIVTHTALLRRIGTIHGAGLDPSFGSTPFNLFGNVCQIGRTQIGIHGPRFELHRSHRKLFIGKLGIGMLGKTLVDRTVDLLTDMADKALAASAPGGGQFLHPLLLEVRPQFGLASSLLAVPLLSLAQLAVKGAIVFAGTRRYEVGDAHINSN